jgi:hypothetical protein
MVTPITGLGAGNYTATVRVTGGNGILETVDVNFTVDQAEIIGFAALPPLVAGEWDALPTAYQTAAGVSSALLAQYPEVTALYAGGQTPPLTVALWTNDAADYAPTLPSGNPADQGEYTFWGTVGTLGSNFTNPSNLRPAVTVIIHNLYHGVELDASGHAFPTAQYGYTPEGKTITVTNIGVQDAGDLSLTLDNANFTFEDGSQSMTLGGVGVGVPGTFTVKPAAGLAPGTYTATVTVASGEAANADLVSKSYALSFTVTDAWLSGFAPIEADGGTAQYAPVFANAAAAVAYLDANYGTAYAATAYEDGVPVPVASWSAAGPYDANTPGRYLFTAALGSLPAHYANPYNYTATAEIVLRAPVHAGAPVIITNPASISEGFVGAAYPLALEAASPDGGTLAYQWYTGTPAEYAANGGAAIPGADGAVYTVTGASPGTLYYWCVVTNTNAGVTGGKTAQAKSALTSVTLRYAELAVVNGVISGGPYSGRSAGSFAAGDTVTVAAAAPPDGQRFDRWTQTPELGVALPSGASGTITVPAGDVTLTAHFEPNEGDNPLPATYAFTARAGTGGALSGTANGSYAPGTAISVTAVPNNGWHFTGWTARGVALADAAANPAAFRMPEGAVALAAAFGRDSGADAELNVQTAVFDKYAQSAEHRDIPVVLSPGSYTLTAVKIGGDTLAPGAAYTVSGDTYTIRKEYLVLLGLGTHRFTFDMNGGADPVLTVTVGDSTPAGDGAPGDTGGAGGGASPGSGGGSSGGSGGSGGTSSGSTGSGGGTAAESGGAAQAPARESTIPAAHGAVRVDYTQSGSDVTLSLPQSKIGEIVGKAEGAADFDLTGLAGATSAALTKTALAAFADAGLTLIIRLPQGTVTLDPEAARSLVSSAQGGVDRLAFTLRKISAAELNAAQSAAMKPGDTVYEICVLSGTQQIHSFEGRMTLGLAYEGRVPTETWYLGDEGEKEAVPATLDETAKTVVLTLSHLSYYGFGVEGDGGAKQNETPDGNTPPAVPPSTESGSGGAPPLWLAIFPALALAVVIPLALRRRRGPGNAAR